MWNFWRLTRVTDSVLIPILSVGTTWIPKVPQVLNVVLMLIIFICICWQSATSAVFDRHVCKIHLLKTVLTMWLSFPFPKGSFWTRSKLIRKYAGFPNWPLVNVTCLLCRQSAFRSPCCNRWMPVRPIALAAAKLRRDCCPVEPALSNTETHSMQKSERQNQENWVIFLCGISLEAIAREILAKEQARLGHVKFLAVDSGDWLCLNPHTFSGHNFDTKSTTSAECSPYVDHFHMYLLAICHQRSVWQARLQNSSSENCIDYVTFIPLSQRIVVDSVKVDPKVCRLSKLAACKCNVPPMSTKCL